MPGGRQFNLVLLPGLDGTGILFQPLLRALPQEVRPTVIGYPRDRRLSIEEYARFVADRLPPGEVVLLAESFSGRVALRLLRQSGAAIRRVLFVAAFANPPHPVLLRTASSLPGIGFVMRRTPGPLLRAACLGGESGHDELRLVKDALAAVSSQVLSHRLHLMAQPPALDGERFEVPCHYLRAGNDRLIPADEASWFQRHFESCDVEAIPGPHMLLQTRPRACAAWIAQKLALR